MEPVGDEVKTNTIEVRREEGGGIDFDYITDLAMRCLQMVGMGMLFRVAPNLFSGSLVVGVLCVDKSMTKIRFIGSVFVIIQDKAKKVIGAIDSIWKGHFRWVGAFGGAAIFSVLPSGKWPIAAIASGSYIGYTLFEATQEEGNQVKAKETGKKAAKLQPVGLLDRIIAVALKILDIIVFSLKSNIFLSGLVIGSSFPNAFTMTIKDQLILVKTLRKQSTSFPYS